MVKHVGLTYYARVGHVLGLALCRVFLLSFFFFTIFYISKIFIGSTYSSVLTCIFNTIIDFIWILIIFLILMYLI